MVQPEPEPEPEPNTNSSVQNSDITYATKCGLVTAYIITITLIILGNLCVVITIVRSKRLHTVTHFFILSLAIADICVGAFVVPASLLALLAAENFGSFVCKSCHFFNQLSLLASSFSMVVIAVDRFKAVVFPLRPRTTLKQCAVAIAGLWFVAALLSIRQTIVYEATRAHVVVNGREIIIAGCKTLSQFSDLKTAFIILDVVFVFLLPFCTVSTMYISIIKKMTDRKVHGSNEEQNRRNTRRVVNMLIALILMFLVCQLPENVLSVHSYFGGTQPSTEIFTVAKYFFKFLAFANHWLNVAAYAYFNPDVRSAFVKSIQAGWKPSNRVCPQTKTTTGL